MQSTFRGAQSLDAMGLANVLGETPSLNSYGGVPDGTTDNRTQLQNLINAVSSNGGGIARIPTGTWAISDYVTVPSNVWLVGAGPSSILKRVGTITASYGLLTVSGSNVRLSDFLIEGAVTSPSIVNYSAISTPEDAQLTANSSIWFQPGISHIRCNRVQIQHTGGYACFIDVRTGNSSDFRFSDCVWLNNRPHNFTDGITIGGSWTGGIYVSGYCTSANPYYVSDVRIRECTWERNAGNCFWSHSTGFAVNHLFFRVSDCKFEDCGLDAVEFGNVYGGGVTNCNFHRIGYLCSSDTATPTPAYVGTPGSTALKGAVCVDTSGFASAIAHANNSMISVNGYGYNLDGMRNSTITGGCISIPLSTDPNYSIDSVSQFGVIISGTLTQVSKGIETGNTSQNGGASNITITGVSIFYMNEISISLVEAKYCVVTNCNIVSTSTLTSPIVITGISGGTSEELMAYSNVVSNNTINYNQPNVCVTEAPNPSTGLVYNNIIKDNVVVQ